MNTIKTDEPATAEEIACRLAEFRRLGLARNLPAQVVYQDPHIVCPWPDCGMRINAIQFHLEAWPDLERRLLEAWWQGPGLVGRCPTCGRNVLFGLTTKSAISEPSPFSSAMLPVDWAEKAYIVSKPRHANQSTN